MDNNYSLNLELLPKELKLLLEIINMEENNRGIEPTFFNKYNDINWNFFIQLAMHHRVYPLLYSKVKKISSKFIPKWVVQILYQEYKRNTFKMLHLCSEMEKLNKKCQENRIPLINLKGPILAAELYGDISLRTSNDLDILIPFKHLEKIEGILTGTGYVKDDYIETILNDWKWRHHHITYINPKKDVKIEVHWRLNPGPGKEPNFDELWERRRISTLTNNPIYFLSEEDLFLFLVSHGARHGWSRLRWLIDIQQIVRQDLDWLKIQRKLKKYNFLDIGGQALILSSYLLTTEISEKMSLLLKGNKPQRLAQETTFYLEEMVNLHTDPVPDHVAKYHKHHLFSLMSKQQKFLFILSFLYPYPDDAKTLPLPKTLHFLYFPLRPFLWAWRKTRIHALPRRT
ncbi:nucleotidyltransferase family protein [Bacillus sp. V3B]|uniref:nucleotidyltransferase domain-containing protein n=1 Tax=Bacillus sp. V3B TaxID=2804915 RepID=UPI00210B0058|nr:nucleotidyltransferase family protein [Bacillus sp. V3B]MCQ6275270.1 nucleotidyltransferase family protein [Bacillus sp. V3B]